MELRDPITKHGNGPDFVHVDGWHAIKVKRIKKGKEEKEVIEHEIPEECKIFKSTKDSLYLPISQMMLNADDMDINYFRMNSKRCYNTPEMKNHFTHYLNYFLRFYDYDYELVAIYYRIKYMIDCYEQYYTKDALIYDIKTYILNGSLMYKVRKMNNDNYIQDLKYENKNNPGLKYNNNHAKILMEISLLSVIIIPLLTHFMHVRKVINIKYFLLEVFDIIIHMYSEADIYNKLYETAISNVCSDVEDNSILWEKNNIRGRNTTTHSIDTVETLLLQIIPKYTYDRNIIGFNYASIRKDIGYKVIDISYEFQFYPLSSSRRDEDNNSDFDKFESQLTKQDESLFIQNKVNCEDTMKKINMIYGPFDPQEINFYATELSKDGKPIINAFQKDLIFNLFYKYFGDPISINAINKEDYIKLMIAGKKILEDSHLIVLPYILSSRVNRLVYRKNINKKELQKLESSPYFNMIREKYLNTKVDRQILKMIATIISSEFQIIDYHNNDIHGTIIDSGMSDYICEELLFYINLI